MSQLPDLPTMQSKRSHASQSPDDAQLKTSSKEVNGSEPSPHWQNTAGSGHDAISELTNLLVPLAGALPQLSSTPGLQHCTQRRWLLHAHGW